MKSILYILVFIFSISCVEETLDLTPLDSLTSEQVFTTEENLERYINSLYEMPGTFPPSTHIYGSPANGGVGDFQYVTDARSDITFNGQFVEKYYVPGAYTPLDEDLWYWDELRRINYFLDNYNRSEESAEVKNHYAGIARWFRAKFYFNKVKRFGDVPWYGSTLGSSDEDLYKERDPREVVMDSVLADLDFAVEHIRDEKDPTSTTITKWVALGLKSRICLFEGTFRKYHSELGLANADEWLQNAADAADEVMQSGQYSINITDAQNEDYHSLFISDNAVSEEVMLANAHSDNLEVWHGSTNHYSNTGGRYMTSLTKSFVNTYLNIDGSRFTDIPGSDTIFFSREVINRDLRLSQTIRTPGYVRSDGSTPAPFGGVSTTLYHPIKYSHPDPFFDDVARNVNDIPLMRYAEILLNFAEAKAELGTFTNGDWQNTIALLRERAGITDTSMPETLDSYLKENFYENVTSIPIMEIRRERGIELILERFRWDDLMRWKEGGNLSNEYDGIYVPEMNKLFDLNNDGRPDVSFVSEQPANSVSGVYYMIIDGTSIKLSNGTYGKILVKPDMIKEFPEYKYLAPIPPLELQLNPNLVQNEGWQ
ncbi:RagB/SusD family nutrient uptake outer membrane protein [Membranihabitans maritimus]|uniref:RagB/SusD family nutrient uptake outer membrane protein n=1 Tax=Membranihabitans maritimus TaxID=2904244 RepID=UPI001F26EB9A|nr:RagB/SusD family nutrient uptake outer membrane protein [Membranihabitans maritimus]